MVSMSTLYRNFFFIFLMHVHLNRNKNKIMFNVKEIKLENKIAPRVLFYTILLFNFNLTKKIISILDTNFFYATDIEMFKFMWKKMLWGLWYPWICLEFIIDVILYPKNTIFFGYFMHISRVKCWMNGGWNMFIVF